MKDPVFLALLLFIGGILLGGLITYLFSKMKWQQDSLSKQQVEDAYVLKDLYTQLEMQSDLQNENLKEKENEIKQLSIELAELKQQSIFLMEKLDNQKREVDNLQQQARTEFENISNKLLEEKSQKFTLQNKEQIETILQPLQEKIRSFEENIERKHRDETKDRISLKKEIEHLRELNQQLSSDANNLANALKGDSKTQGDWGEVQLELILERSGLEKGIHFQSQSSFKDVDGNQKRPDFIINLPEDKHLIIDSKVSLTAYERYVSTQDKSEKEQHLKEHLSSVHKHIDDLNSKNYQNLYQINSPDYLILFIPIESALTTALQADQKLFLKALDKNIVMVSTSTLLATMRTVSYIWTQEKQKRSVLEIARQSGLLYDKFVAFVSDLKDIGQRLNQAQDAYQGAMNKLTESKKHGDTLIGRAQKIKQLGAKASKDLPKDLLE